ncbi:MAG TPA: SMR family transporter [Thermodesulfobacteriota bacterium]|nr:SMR family transporter [Thermodesulfobacteriota bacterium]
MKILFLILAIAFNVASYVLYKYLAGREGGLFWSLLFALGLLLGGTNIWFFTKALKNISLSVAYPVFSGACILLMAILTHLFFGEKLSPVNMAGALVIIVGIALMSY